MKLYYSPGACSLGIHLLLEEIGKPYDLVRLSFPDREQYGPVFTAINPKSKVPTLVRDDGSVLTEYGAVAAWLARTNPEAHLLPADPEDEARAREAIDYCVGTVHMQGFARLFRSTNFAPNEADHGAVQARGREIIDRGFRLLADKLDGRAYVAGDFSIGDTALFYVTFWAAARLQLPLPDAITAHYARMRERPAVQRALAQEGLAA